jgi:hypothetical protein
MPENKHWLLIIVFLLFITSLSGQTRHPQVQKRSGEQQYSTLPTEQVTAIAVVANDPIESSVVFNGKTVIIPRDEEAEGYHYFLSLPVRNATASGIQINVSDPNAEIYFINSGDAPSVRVTTGRLDNPCEELPPVVLQSQWRDGLDDPVYSRSFHEVKHLIVHHSAGSNSNTNYTQVVRDIYLYHTEVNGWSDIGYNFLIAQDGTLYAGRDPGEGDQSLVRGAHFCGANTNTLGVCMLGNYETALATQPSIDMLQNLLVYEVITNELDPLGERPHSTGQLNTIAGHRDGCATLCPGEDMYTRLPDIRNNVLMTSLACSGEQSLDFAFDHEVIGVGHPLTLSNRSTGYHQYHWYIDGQVQEISKEQFSFYVPGTYDLGIIGETLTDSDSLIIANAVRVSWLEKEPIIFPNPSSERMITIDYRPDIKEITLSSLSGKEHITLPGVDATIQLPDHLGPGIYLITITTEDGHILTEKVVIE